MTWVWILLVLIGAAVPVEAQVRIRIGSAAAAPPPEGNSPLSREEHPRMFQLDSTRLTAHKALLMNGGPYQDYWNTVVDAADALYSTHESVDSRRKYVPYTYAKIWYLHPGDAGSPITVQGISYGHTKQQYFDKAVEEWEYLRDNLATPFDSANYANGLCPAYDILATAGGIDSVRKADWISWIITANLDNAGFRNPYAAFNSQTTMHYATLLLCGLAFDGESEDGTNWGAARVAEWSTRWLGDTGIVTRRAFEMGLTSGGGDLTGSDWPEGEAYRFYDGEVSLLYGLEGYRTATTDAPDTTSKATFYGTYPTNVVQGLPAELASYVMPWATVDTSYPGGANGRKWQFYNPGYGAASDVDLYNSITDPPSVPNVLIFMNNGVNSTAARLAQWLQNCKFENRTACGAASNQVYTNPAYTGYLRARGGLYSAFLLATEPSPLDPDAAGVSTVFRSHSRFFARTGYTSANDSMVSIEAAEWQSGNFGRRCPGQLLLVHRGAGLFRKGNGSDPHDRMNSGGLRFGHCSGLLFQPTGVTNPNYDLHNYGGPKNESNVGAVSSFVTNSRMRILSAGRDSISATFPCTYNDLTKAYNNVDPGDALGDGIEPDEVLRAERVLCVGLPSTLATDPTVLFVMDRAVPQSGSNVPRILWQPTGEGTITVDGSTSAGPARLPTNVVSSHTDRELPSSPGTEGKLQSSTSHYFEWSNTSNGADVGCRASVVQPTAPNFVIVGGPNSAAQSWQATSPFSHEGEDSFGVLWRAGEPNTYYRSWFGAYRVEVTDPGSSNRFLTVVVCDNAGTTHTAPTAFVTNGAGDNDFIGAAFGGRLAIFGEDGDNKAAGDIQIGTAGTYTTVWNDLTPSTQRTLTPGANINLGSGAGVAITPTPDAGGVVRITVTVTGSGSGAAYTVTVS
jgi:hypothetical protein